MILPNRLMDCLAYFIGILKVISIIIINNVDTLHSLKKSNTLNFVGNFTCKKYFYYFFFTLFDFKTCLTLFELGKINGCIKNGLKNNGSKI